MFGSGSSHKILYPYCTSSVLRICILLDMRDLAIASPSDCQQILAEDYATGTSAVPIACIFQSLGQALRESTAPLATSAQVTDTSGFLPHWATMSRMAAALGHDRNLRARASSEDREWVKYIYLLRVRGRTGDARGWPRVFRSPAMAPFSRRWPRSPEVGAVCGSAARTDVRGGRSAMAVAMAVPTATPCSQCTARDTWEALTFQENSQPKAHFRKSI